MNHHADDPRPPVICGTHNCAHADYDHESGETTVCRVRGCDCMGFVGSMRQTPATIDAWQEYLRKMKTTEEKVAAILHEIHGAKNLTNQEFVFLFWHFHDGYALPPQIHQQLTDMESITRTKRKMVELHPEFEPDNENLIMHKALKHGGIMDYVLNHEGAA